MHVLSIESTAVYYKVIENCLINQILK